MEKPPNLSALKALKMDSLRRLCKSFSIDVPSGRVSKRDLFEAAAQHFNFPLSGSGPSGDVDSVEKRELPLHIREAYRRLPSFTRITSGWAIDNLIKLPPFTTESVKDYLLFSPDKDYDGESLRCYKQLRAYQLFYENHIFDVEANLWEGGTDFFFVRAKCRPSQDTSKPAHKCTICVDRHEGKCYGAHCRCVSGLGEACSHVAALLFALDDFTARGLHRLNGPAVTEKLCEWCKPCLQKVEPTPVANLILEKASPGERKRKKWCRTGISRYDPRHRDDRRLDDNAIQQLRKDLRDAVNDCGFLRLRYDLDEPPETIPTGPIHLPDTMSFDDDALLPAAEVVCESEPLSCNAEYSKQVTLAQQKLSNLVDIEYISDDFIVSQQKLDNTYQKVVAGLKLGREERDSLEQRTRGQSTNVDWHAEHCGRITASMVHRVITRRANTPPDKLVHDIMGYGSKKALCKNYPRLHGHLMESEAREAYVTTLQDVDVMETG